MTLRGDGVKPVIAVLAAQVEEVAPLLARCGARHDRSDATARYWRSDLDHLVFAVSGMGRRRARAAASALLERPGISHLVVIGVGGALTSDLEIGALVVAESVIADDAPPLHTDPRGVRAALDAGARAASLVTVDRMVATAADRQAVVGIARAAGLCGAAVVDMESYDAVAEAVARGLPATVLRAVSDGAGENLPAFLGRCRRADGDLDRRRAALLALAHPRSIPALYELRRRVRLGSEALAGLVARLLAAPG